MTSGRFLRISADAVLPLTGTIVTDDPARYLANPCAPGAHRAARQPDEACLEDASRPERPLGDGRSPAAEAGDVSRVRALVPNRQVSVRGCATAVPDLPLVPGRVSAVYSGFTTQSRIISIRV